MGQLSRRCGQGKPGLSGQPRWREVSLHQPKIFQRARDLPGAKRPRGAWGSVPSAGIHANAVLSFPPRSEPDTLFTPPSPLELFGELC